MDHAVKVISERVAAYPKHHVVQAVIWSTPNQDVNFHETSNGQSSSVLALKDHSKHYPDIVVTNTDQRTTSTLTEILDWELMPVIGLLNLDIQGAELHALQGLDDNIARVEAVYSEVNTQELYEGCAQLDELDSWLQGHGFTRLEMELTSEGWGDAFWLRNDLLPRSWRLTLLGDGWRRRWRTFEETFVVVARSALKQLR